MKKKIAIIGVGIAGLTLANLIKKNSDFEFMLYEKEESLSLDDGFGIQLATNSVSILNKIDFQKVNSKDIFHPKAIDFFTIKNEKICDLEISKFNSEYSKYTTLRRSTLIEFLKDEIYTQHLRFGKRIKEVTELKGKVLIKFHDNTNDLVDYVVGADGIFSNTRSFFDKKANQPSFKKAIAVRLILKTKNNLDINEKNISLFMGSNLHLVIYPINQKNELNLVCIIRDKKYDPDSIKSLIERKLLSQNPNLKDLFKDDLKSWPLYSTSKVVPSSNNKVFYIGDAFNGFLPTLAQGGGQSIESAYELFNLIKDENLDASNIYFKKRLERTKVVRRRSNFNFFAFHFSSSVMQKIRNFFLKFLVKRKGFINSYLGTVYKN
jgi:salicylate hydroxylase